MRGIPLLDTTALALTVDGETIYWSIARRRFGKLTALESASFSLDNAAGKLPEILDKAGRSAFVGIVAEERYVRHLHVDADDPADDHSVAAQAFHKVLPENVSPENFHFAYRCHQREYDRRLTVSAISEVAFSRSIDILTQQDVKPDVVSSSAQDLPFILAYDETFIAGRKRVLVLADEYAVFNEYNDSALVRSHVIVGQHDDIIEDLVANDSIKGDSGVSGPEIFVVGKQAVEFLQSASVGGLTSFKPPAVVCPVTFVPLAPDGNLRSASLAIRMAFEGVTGCNFIRESELAARIRMGFSRDLKHIRLAAASIITITLLAAVGWLVHSKAQLRDLHGEVARLRSLAGQVEVRHRQLEQSRIRSATMQSLLRRQTTVSRSLDMLGRARPERIRFTGITLSRDNRDSLSSALSVEGIGTAESSLVELVRRLEDAEGFSNIQLTTARNSHSADNPGANAFVVTANYRHDAFNTGLPPEIQ